MSARTLLLALLLMTAPFLAGCIASSDDGGQDEEAGPTDTDQAAQGNESSAAGNGTSSGGNATGNQTGNATSSGNETGSGASDGSDGPRYTYDNRTGTVDSTNLVVASEGNETEVLTVKDGTLQLFVNLTAEDGELEMCIRSPEASGECTQTVTTEDGNATFQARAPTSGDWTIELEATGTGANSVDYLLEIAQQVPAS